MTDVSISAPNAQPSVLDRLSGYSRDRLLRISERRSFDVGATILNEGGVTPFLGVLETGRVALRLRVPEMGESVTILTVEPGELLGWSAVVPPYRATADAVVAERATLLAYRAPELRATLQADCDLAAELLPIVLESVSARLGGSWHQLLDMFAARASQPW